MRYRWIVIAVVAGSGRARSARRSARDRRQDRITQRAAHVHGAGVSRLPHHRQGGNADRSRPLASRWKALGGGPQGLAPDPAMQRPAAHMPKLELTGSDRRARRVPRLAEVIDGGRRPPSPPPPGRRRRPSPAALSIARSEVRPPQVRQARPTPARDPRCGSKSGYLAGAGSGVAVAPPSRQWRMHGPKEDAMKLNTLLVPLDGSTARGRRPSPRGGARDRFGGPHAPAARHACPPYPGGDPIAAHSPSSRRPRSTGPHRRAHEGARG